MKNCVSSMKKKESSGSSWWSKGNHANLPIENADRTPKSVYTRSSRGTGLTKEI